MHKVWTVLEKLFSTQSKARAMQLRFMLQTLKKGNLDFDEYILKMRNLADDLNSIGHIISDDDLILYIRGGFRPIYESVVVNLTSRNNSLILLEVQFVLQTHKMRLHSQLSSGHVAFQPAANVT